RPARSRPRQGQARLPRARAGRPHGGLVMAPNTLRSPSPAPLLEAALALAIQLLIARHPDLLLPDSVPRIRPPPGLRNPRPIAALANALLAELAHYDALEPPAATPATDASDEIPF